MPDSRKPTAADHAWAEEQARQIEAAMPEAVEGDLVEMPAEDIDRIVERAKRHINEWNSKHGHGRGPVDPFLASEHGHAIMLRDLVYTVRYLRAALSRAEAERDEAVKVGLLGAVYLDTFEQRLHAVMDGDGIEALLGMLRAPMAVSRQISEVLARISSASDKEKPDV